MVVRRKEWLSSTTGGSVQGRSVITRKKGRLGKSLNPKG